MKQILTRLLLTLPVVWLVVSLVFLLIHIVPGDPILQMLGEGATPADIDSLRHAYYLDQPLWVLPSIAMGASLAAILTRMVRTAMLEELGQDYIRTARAKGLSERAVVWRHALPNALVPIVTVVGLQFGALLAGAIVTEKIFSWPGLGRLVVDAISNRDYALVQGCLLSIGLTYVLVNLLTDVVYRWVNPRMR
jgi:ABC-type dipeptide/oligopeptide/nickel transport system permease component